MTSNLITTLQRVKVPKLVLLFSQGKQKKKERKMLEDSSTSSALPTPLYQVMIHQIISSLWGQNQTIYKVFLSSISS